jgi:hypothetical protein
LRRKSRILPSLNHPGIATLHGLEDSDSGVPVLVMELVEGETPFDRLSRGLLPPPKDLSVFSPDGKWLAFYQERGPVQRA